MSAEHEYGEPVEYQIMWKSGAVETIKAHQVSWPNNLRFSMFGASQGGAARTIQFHGEFNGRWQLVLSANEDDMISVRNLSSLGEPS